MTQVDIATHVKLAVFLQFLHLSSKCTLRLWHVVNLCWQIKCRAKEGAIVHCIADHVAGLGCCTLRMEMSDVVALRYYILIFQSGWFLKCFFFNGKAHRCCLLASYWCCLFFVFFFLYFLFLSSYLLLLFSSSSSSFFFFFFSLFFIFLMVVRGTTQNGGQATRCLQRPVGWKLLLQLVTLVPGFGHMAQNPALIYIRMGNIARHHKHVVEDATLPWRKLCLCLLEYWNVADQSLPLLS